MKKKKILYLSISRLPTEKANGLQTIKMCEYLASHYDIELMYPKRFNKINSNILYYYNCIKKFKITEVKTYDFKYRNFILLKDFINNYNYKIHIVIYFFNILLQIRKKNFDYIFIRDYYLLYLFYKFKIYLNNIIFEVHSIPKNKLFSKIISNILCTIFISKINFNKYKIKNNIKSILLPDAAEIRELKYTAWIEDKYKFKNNINIAYIGKVQAKGYKKISFFLESIYDFFINNETNIRLLIIGDSLNNLDPQSKSYCEKLVKKNKLKFINHIKYRNLNKIYSIIDVACIPYQKNDHTEYASPLKIFEYISYNKPILTSDVGDTLNILNYENAYIYKENEKLSLINNLIDIEQNFPNKLKKYNFNLSLQYSWEKRCNLLYNYLENEC